jgi:hypothetical protein
MQPAAHLQVGHESHVRWGGAHAPDELTQRVEARLRPAAAAEPDAETEAPAAVAVITCLSGGSRKPDVRSAAARAHSLDLERVAAKKIL